MSYFITGLICFIGGAVFGFGWAALLSAGKQADRDMGIPDEQ